MLQNHPTLISSTVLWYEQRFRREDNIPQACYSYIIYPHHIYPHDQTPILTKKNGMEPASCAVACYTAPQGHAANLKTERNERFFQTFGPLAAEIGLPGRYLVRTGLLLVFPSVAFLFRIHGEIGFEWMGNKLLKKDATEHPQGRAGLDSTASPKFAQIRWVRHLHTVWKRCRFPNVAPGDEWTPKWVGWILWRVLVFAKQNNKPTINWQKHIQ